MSDLMGILLGGTALAICFYGFFKDAKNKTWAILASLYGADSTNTPQGGYQIQMVFFKSQSSSKFDYFGSMKLRWDDDGILIIPTINRYFVKPVFLPHSELEKVGKKRLFLLNRTIYQVKGTNVLIGLRP